MTEPYQRIEAWLKKLPNPPPSYRDGLRIESLTIPDRVSIWSSDETHIRREVTHLHSRYVISMILRGSVTLTVDDQRYVLKRGDGLLVFPHQRHVNTIQPGRKLLRILVSFDIREAGSIEMLRNYQFRITTGMLKTFQELLPTYLGGQYTLYGGNDIALITARLINDIKAGQVDASLRQSSPQYHDLIQQVSRYIHEHIHEPFGVDELARHMNISNSYLRTLFRKATHKSLGFYIASSRIYKAVNLLVHTEMKISQIATECGFTSLSSFSRTFHQHARRSPRAYRQQFGQIARKKPGTR